MHPSVVFDCYPGGGRDSVDHVPPQAEHDPMLLEAHVPPLIMVATTVGGGGRGSDSCKGCPRPTTDGPLRTPPGAAVGWELVEGT